MELSWHLKMHLGLCVLGPSPYITRTRTVTLLDSAVLRGGDHVSSFSTLHHQHAQSWALCGPMREAERFQQQDEISRVPTGACP